MIRRSHAQHGEDLVIARLLREAGVTRPTYLDCGAFHPFVASNTAYFYERGSRGVCVDPEPETQVVFEAWRPEDKFVPVALAAKAGRRTFYRSILVPGASSMVPGNVERYGGKVDEVLDVEAVTIDDVVRDHCGGRWPDLLSVDLEGFDLEVMASSTFNGSRPRVICVEVWAAIDDGGAMSELLRGRGYQLAQRVGDTNDVYVWR